MRTSSLVPLLASLLAGFVLGASADCPVRQSEAWEHNPTRMQMVAEYKDYNLKCPEVSIALLPDRISLNRDTGEATLGLSIVTAWLDPSLKVDSSSSGTIFKVNVSEIWTAKLMTAGLHNVLLTGSTQLIEVNPDIGAVFMLYQTSVKGICSPHLTSQWPRDQLYCHFLIMPLRGESFNLTQHQNITELDGARRKAGIPPKQVERMASWRILKLDSELYPDNLLLIEASMERLPGQLEAEFDVQVVHPACALSALVPASVVLPPGSTERPTLIVTSILLQAVFLLSLPHFTVDLFGDDTPRNLLLHRDSGLLVLLVVAEWLISLRLASRRKPLPAWARNVARGLSALRTPLLLSADNTRNARPQKRPLDEESIGFSEVLDRLTFLAVSAAYLAIVVVSLQ